MKGRPVDLDLRTLATFVKVSELRSFGRAAQALGITQSGVSNAIKRLEAQLGTALLLRTTRSVSLTVDGEAFFHRCRQVLADLADARQVLTGARTQPTGILRVSLPVSFGRLKIVPLLGAFQARYPRVELAVGITDRFVDLVGEGVDVAIRFGALEDSSLIARPLLKARRRIVAAPAYLARHGRPAVPADLERHNCLPLTYHETGRRRRWTLGPAAGQATFTPRGSMAFNDGQALYTAVKAGFGVGQMHGYFVDEDIAAGSLVALLDAFEPEPDGVSIVYPQSRHLSPKVRVFVDFVLGAFKRSSSAPAALRAG